MWWGDFHSTISFITLTLLIILAPEPQGNKREGIDCFFASMEPLINQGITPHLV